MDKKPEGFEVTEYGTKHRHPDKTFSLIEEIIQNQIDEHPNTNIRVAFEGPFMKLSYHCYEMHLPVRLRDVETDARTTLDQTAKMLKKQFKERSGETLKIVEKREMANYSVQKVSLNERYMYVSWRFYELG